ncbi:MAG: hypothetical protein ACRCZ0_11540 [Cetobacterium sp.]
MDRLNRLYATNAERRAVLDKVRDVRDGRSFQHYKDRFYLAQGAEIVNEEVMKKLHIDYKMLNKVIELFTSFCPELELDTPRGDKSSEKIALFKELLTAISWNSMNNSLWGNLETNGDIFYYIYFDSEEDSKNRGDKYRLPKLRRLEAGNMEKIIYDEANNPTSYIYKHKLFDEVINYVDGTTRKENEREETIIFERGRCVKIEPKSKKEGLMELKDGKMGMTKKIIKNSDILADMIPIIHISANRGQEDKFSEIPAGAYVDLCLIIDQIHSDVRAINRNLGFPKTILVDCSIVSGDGRIGGFIEVETKKSQADYDGFGKQGQVIDRQITNGLSSIEWELKHAIDTLYDLAGLTNPTLMQKVSASDSSKMFNQVNMRMEQKIESYVDNIIEAFKPFFKMVLTINNLYDETNDIGFSFKKPTSIIKNSEYDDLLIKQLQLNTGVKTLYDLLKEKGYNDEDIEKHYTKLNEEIMQGGLDIRKETGGVKLEDPIKG